MNYILGAKIHIKYLTTKKSGKYFPDGLGIRPEDFSGVRGYGGTGVREMNSIRQGGTRLEGVDNW